MKLYLNYVKSSGTHPSWVFYTNWRGIGMTIENCHRVLWILRLDRLIMEDCQRNRKAEEGLVPAPCADNYSKPQLRFSKTLWFSNSSLSPTHPILGKLLIFPQVVRLFLNPCSERGLITSPHFLTKFWAKTWWPIPSWYSSNTQKLFPYI